MMLRRALGIPVSVVLAVTACGGKVVVDLAGQGGAGGSATTTGAGGADLCEQACGVLAARGCADGTCAAPCKVALTTACADVVVKLLGCLRDQAAGASSCLVDACLPEREDLQTCASKASCETPVMGSGDPGTCVGKGICGGVERATQCDGSGFCTCLLGPGTVGACQETGPFLCDFFDGCCAKLFPKGG